ncbi:MAG: hypothetical protein H3Z52_04580 [archaeon]|nr:hypothetical protein [archaeon]
MGHVNVKLKLANPIELEKSIEKLAIVDTGATFTTLPLSIANNLNLNVIGKIKVKTATKIDQLDQSYAYIEINDKKTVTPVLISKTLDRILIGVITLEALGLAVDPTTGQLKEAEILLLTCNSI